MQSPGSMEKLLRSFGPLDFPPLIDAYNGVKIGVESFKEYTACGRINLSIGVIAVGVNTPKEFYTISTGW